MTPSLPLKPAPRGLAHIEDPLPRVVTGAVLALAMSSYIAWQQVGLFRSWSQLFEGLGAWFGLKVSVTLSNAPALDELAVVVGAQATLPSTHLSALGAMALGVVLWLVSSALAAERVPARYGLRALALVVGLPAAGFWALGLDPELNVQAHVAQVFRMGYWFILVTPVLFALTGFVLPGNVAKKVLWTLAALLYFFTSVPVLALLHLQVLTLAGAAFAPSLNVLFMVLVMSLHLVAFYSLVASCED